MRVLRLLVWLLPGDFRREYGGELLSTARDRWIETGHSLGPVARAGFWGREWRAAFRAAIGLRRAPKGASHGHAVVRRHRFTGVGKDVRHAARSLRKQPGFAAVSALTLGLGIGATTAMFSAVNSVLLRDLPYRGPDEIVVLRQTDTVGGTRREGMSAANLADVARSARTLSAASLADGVHGLRMVEDGRAISLRSWVVSAGFFDVMGATALLGRTFRPEEFVAGGDRVVLLSHGAWQDRFGGDPGIVGRELTLDGSAHRVVGVMPVGFRYPSDSDTWTPRPPLASDAESRGNASMHSVARLAPGATLASVRSELSGIATALAAAHPVANTGLGFEATGLREYMFGHVASPLILLLCAVGLVLLVAAANVAGLQLARGSGRAREFVLRASLGASSGRILRLVLTESLLLGGIGTILGIGFAYLGVGLIEALGPDHLPRIDELRIDGVVLAFALLAAVSSASVAGVMPALQASRTDLTGTLSESSRGSTAGRRSGRLRDRLVVAEIAVALVLTIGAGLLVRSFDRLLDNDLGFVPEGRLALQVWAYDDSHQSRLEFFGRSVAEIRDIPGVEVVGLTSDLPLADNRSILSIGRTTRFTVAGEPTPARGAEPLARVAAMDSGFTRAMGIAVRVGRGFATHDVLDSPPVVVVNEAFAARYLAGTDPLGRRLLLHRLDDRPREIVGVLADVRRRGLESEAEPEIYVPLSQQPSNGLTFVVKAGVDPATLITAVQEATWSADPSQAIWAILPMTDLLEDWIRQRRFNTAVLVGFAGLALSLAAVGVYGLMSFSVAQRVGELGIRRALGGPARDILRLVLGRALTLAVAGVGLGLLGSLALTRALQGMLFEVGPFDPLTFIVLSVFVVALAVLAAFLPARRATRIDPMVALRRGST